MNSTERRDNLTSIHEIARDGHFAASEQSELFSTERWAAFQSLR